MIENLTDEIDKQAWQYKQDEAKKKQSDKEKLKAIFNRAKASSQSSNGSVGGIVSPRDPNFKTEPDNTSKTPT